MNEIGYPPIMEERVLAVGPLAVREWVRNNAERHGDEWHFAIATPLIRVPRIFPDYTYKYVSLGRVVLESTVSAELLVDERGMTMLTEHLRAAVTEARARRCQDGALSPGEEVE